MKFFVNTLSFVLFLFAVSSINPANAQQQQQQRPSQRPFAAVLAKMKEKQSGRNRELQQFSQPEDKIPPPEKSNPPMKPKVHTLAKPTTASAIPAPNPALLPSRQPMKIPQRPPGHG